MNHKALLVIDIQNDITKHYTKGAEFVPELKIVSDNVFIKSKVRTLAEYQSAGDRP